MMALSMSAPPSIQRVTHELVEKMRQSYEKSGRSDLRIHLIPALELQSVAYNMNNEIRKYIGTVLEILQCVGDSVLKYCYIPDGHKQLAMNYRLLGNTRASKRVANELLGLVRVRSGIDKRLFLLKYPELAVLFD